MASKIKEITDIGRTMHANAPASTAQSSFVDRMSCSTSTSSHTDPTKAKMSLGTSQIVDSKKRKLDTVKPSVINGNFGRSKKVALASVAEHGSDSTLMNIDLLTADAIADDTILIIQENKRLRVEVATLTQANQCLTQANQCLQALQMSREHEIRVEVSQEMSERCNTLLKRIDDLQTQLNTNKDSRMTNITHSVRKVRMLQIDEAKDEETNHLEEAENEISRMKAEYETEVKRLNDDKQRLTEELKALQDRTFAASSETAVQEFSKRMQRDGRFKKGSSGPTATNQVASIAPAEPTLVIDIENIEPMIVESTTASNVMVEKPVIKGRRTKSLTRSPLGQLRDDGNSPIRMDTKKVITIKSSGPAKATESAGDAENQPAKTTNTPGGGRLDEPVVLRRALRSRVRI